MITIYGLKTCDTCRKARRAAEKAGRDVKFVDVRETPLAPETRSRFLEAFGQELVNRKSTTWRGLSEEERSRDAETLLAEHPTLMKRPVIDGETLTLGWTTDVQAAHLG